MNAQLKACQIDEQKRLCLSLSRRTLVCFNASLSFMPRIPKKMIYLLFFIPPKGQDSLPEASQKEWGLGRLNFLKGKQKEKALWS